MQGVKQELFSGPVRNSAETVAEFTTETLAIEKTLDMHSRQYDFRNNPVMAIRVNVADLSSDSSLETIRAVVREDLTKLFPMTPQAKVLS